MALEELSVIIDIVDSFSEEINELLADLETVDVEAGRVEDLFIDVDVFGQREIAELEASLASITDENVNIDVDAVGEENISNLKRQLSTLTDELINLNVETVGERKIAELEAELSALSDETVNIDVNNLTPDEIATIQSSLASLTDKNVDVDADVHGKGEIVETIALLSSLEAFDSNDINVDLADESIAVDINNLTSDEIATIQSSLASLTDKNVDVDADVHGKGEILETIALLSTLKAMTASDLNIGIGVDSDMSQMFATGGGGSPASGIPARGDGPEEGLLSFSMSDLHNVMAKLVPLLLVFVGALPAAIAGVYSLAAAAASAAAALGTLGGLSLYGFALQLGDGNAMKGLQEIINRVQEDFANAFAPLARDLAPLAQDAIEGLETLFNELASHGDILRSLTDEARAFGSFMQEYIVGVATSLGKLANVAAPVFALLGDIVKNLDLTEKIAGFLADVLPSLVAFGAALADIATRLAKLSIGFLQVASMAIQFLDTIVWIVSGFGMFEKTIGRAIASLLALTTVLSILNSTVLMNAISAVYELGYAYVAAAMSQLFAVDTTAILESGIYSLTASIVTLGAALAVVTGGLYLVGMIAGAIGSKFLSTSDAIDKATKSLEQFQNMQSNIDGMGGGGSVVYQFAPSSQRTTINEQNVQDAHRVVKSKHFSNAEVSS